MIAPWELLTRAGAVVALFVAMLGGLVWASHDVGSPRRPAAGSGRGATARRVGRGAAATASPAAGEAQGRR